MHRIASHRIASHRIARMLARYIRIVRFAAHARRFLRVTGRITGVR